MSSGVSDARTSTTLVGCVCICECLEVFDCIYEFETGFRGNHAVCGVCVDYVNVLGQQRRALGISTPYRNDKMSVLYLQTQ